MAKFSSVLLDLGGVVFVGSDPIPGAVEGVDRLKKSGIAIRFLTNTTRQPLRLLREKLQRLGIDASADEVFTPAVAARHRLKARVPYLLVHPDLREDFEPRKGRPDTVVVGDAGATFSYANLNAAFRVLEAGADLRALANNRTFKDGDGALSLDAGPFVAALEFASGRKAEIVGKPSAAFFGAAVDSTGTPPEATVMIGDDVESDVGGALAAGLAGILVRTGKYKAGDEAKIKPGPAAVFDDLAKAVDWILAES